MNGIAAPTRAPRQLRVRRPDGTAHEVDMRPIYGPKRARRLARELAAFLSRPAGDGTRAARWAFEIREDLEQLAVAPAGCTVEVVRLAGAYEPGAVNGWVVVGELPVGPPPGPRAGGEVLGPAAAA